MDILTPEREGSSENCTSGLLNKSSSTEQPTKLSSSTTPLPPFHFSHLSPSPQLQRRKATNLQRSNAGAGLPEWESLVSDVSVRLLSLVPMSVWQTVLRMTPQKHDKYLGSEFDGSCLTDWKKSKSTVIWAWQQGTSPLLNIFTYRLERKPSPPVPISDYFRDRGKHFL